MDQVSEVYMKEIRKALLASNKKKAALLTDKFLVHIKEYALAFFREARELEQEPSSKEYPESIEIASEALRENAREYMKIYSNLLRGQKQGKIPTNTPDFSELEEIANGNNFIGDKYLL